MAEFNDREIKIIHTMTILQNPMLKDVPPELKKTLLTANLQLRGLEFDEREIIDLHEAVMAEQKLVLQKGLAFMNKHGASVTEAMKHLKL